MVDGASVGCAMRLSGHDRMADRQPVSLGWHEDVLIELRRIRQAVEKIAARRGRVGMAMATDGFVGLSGISSERLEELTRRCAEAPRD